MEGTAVDNLQWMPQSEPNQMIHPTEMYDIPPSAGSFIPVPPPHQPYQGSYLNLYLSWKQLYSTQIKKGDMILYFLVCFRLLFL